MRWNEMTWPDIDGLKPDNLILWPLASCEQHGHHLPVGTDNFLVTEIAERVERAMPESVVLLPTLAVGASHHHRGFPGALTLPENLYSSVLQEVVGGIVESSACRPGAAKRLLMLNGHGGNIYPGSAALSEIAWKYRDRPDVIVAFTSYWVAAAKAISGVDMDTPTLTHACEYETSMMLAKRGDLVRMDRASAPDVNWADTRFTPDASRPASVSVAAPFHARSGTGALGSPELATETKGHKLIDAIADDIGRTVQEMLTWPDLDDARPQTES
jgi:creatinine amidohydrolase